MAAEVPSETDTDGVCSLCKQATSDSSHFRGGDRVTTCQINSYGSSCRPHLSGRYDPNSLSRVKQRTSLMFVRYTRTSLWQTERLVSEIKHVHRVLGNDTQDQVRVWPAVCDEQLALLAL